MSTVKLRPYQAQLDVETDEAWRNGAVDVGVNSATGSGKTVFLAHKMRQHNGASIAVAHRQELTSQISIAVARNGIRHRVVGPKAIQKNIVALHMAELGRSYYDEGARCTVAGVDSLVNLPDSDPLFAQTTLYVQDEAHHALRANKWGRARSRFINARALHVSATWMRADGRGLGRHADGFVDVLVNAPTMREIIDMGYLTDYRIYSVKASDLDLTGVEISSATGDLNLSQLRDAVHRSQRLVGDVVREYIKHAPGKLGVTFAVDVEDAGKIAAAFRDAGVPAEVVSAKTPDLLRLDILRRFRRREILQLVNVDLFGEGFDLPAIEVVSFARPTESWALYCLDPETEVLTPDGWKRHDEMNLCDSVIAFDTSTGKTRAAKITGRVSRPMYADERMYQIDAPHLNIAVTNRHDMIVKGRAATCTNWIKQTAEDMSARRSMHKIPVAGLGEFPGAKLTDDELRLLGWYLSDGTISKANNALYIAQSVKKSTHLNSIRSALIGCRFKYGELLRKRKNVPLTHSDLIVFSVSKGKPRGRDKHLTGWARIGQWLDKSIPACYDELTRAQLLILLETLNLGDGNNDHSSLNFVKRTMTIACGTNHKMADRIQALCVTRGLRCNVSHVQYAGRAKWAYLHIRDAVSASLPGTGDADGAISNKKRYSRSRFIKTEYRPDFVWCVSNELGTLITRRNGKVAIVGNCQQFGRVLRLMIDPALYPVWDTLTNEGRRAHIAASGKPRGIVIDHVGNVLRHMGPPDVRVRFTLDARERRGSGAPSDAIPMRVCAADGCNWPYERYYKCCPYCGHYPEPAARSGPEYVDGDLSELSPDVLARMFAEIDRIDGPAVIPSRVEYKVQLAMNKNHVGRQQAQAALRAAMSWWSGLQDALGHPGIEEKYRRFYLMFGIDTASAQVLGAPDAEKLRNKICEQLLRYGIDASVNPALT